MIRLWSCDAPLACPSSNCSRPRTRLPSRMLSQQAAPEPIPPSPTTIASQSRRAAVVTPCAIRTLLDQLDASANVDAAVVASAGRGSPSRRPGGSSGPAEPAPSSTAAAPVASSSAIPRSRREEASPNPAGGLVVPRPDVVAGLAHRRRHDRVDRGRGSSRSGSGMPWTHAGRARIQASSPSCQAATSPATQRKVRRSMSRFRSSHAVPTVGWPANGNSVAGVWIAIRGDAVVDAVDEDRLAEVQVVGDRLAPLRGDLGARRRTRRADCHRCRPVR